MTHNPGPEDSGLSHIIFVVLLSFQTYVDPFYTCALPALVYHDIRPFPNSLTFPSIQKRDIFSGRWALAAAGGLEGYFGPLSSD